MSDLLELAARVEAATGPDRELDLLIAKALGFRALHLAFIPGGSDLAWDPRGSGCGFVVEHYTASLDAALSLVPEGLRIAAIAEQFFEDLDHPWLVKLGFRDRAGGLPTAGGRTPALALTAACLRARAAQGQPS